MSAWPGNDPNAGKWPKFPATDAEADAAGLAKVDVGGGNFKYVSIVDAKELVARSGATIVRWPPGSVGGN